MFQRRIPLSFFQNLRQILWPKMGWWRLLKYYRIRILRLSASAESIAINLAAGSAMSFTPLFGIHVFGALGIAWLIGARVNLVAAMVGTFVGNPWTFPILMYASYAMGDFIIDMAWGHDPEVEFSPDVIEQQGGNLLSYIQDNFSDVFIPTLVGGITLAIISIPIYYMIYVNIVRAGQKARALRIKHKARDKKRMKRKTQNQHKVDKK